MNPFREHRPRWRAAAFVAGLLALGFTLPLRADEPFARTRVYDLQHSRIELQFDTAQRKVIGHVTHTLAPLHGTLNEVEFDAVELNVQKVTVAGKAAQFASARDKLTITLPAPARPGVSVNISISYDARPRRGMYFILPDASYPSRPVQIWTQGQAEDTRYYIPIYDYPNDMTTTETILTVPDSWTALSNGRLLTSKPAGAGKKTWHWRQSKPMSTYLIAVVAGEFAEVKDTWRGIPITYYGPKDRAHLLQPTYSSTKPMMDFFVEKFGAYPWEKYAQATVDEFVADGMENVSLTINTTRQFIYPELEAEARYKSDDLVAHELAHQWFGDLVTTKDWGNIWLNEAFASYGDTLWREHSLGKDDAAYYVWNEGRQWMQGQQNYVTPVVTHDFSDFVMLAGNFYNKGNQIVHMLRGKLGDENFFKAIRHYLKKHAHQNVVTTDLARAIEESTGVNVDSFLEQWVYRAGAPRFRVSYTWDDAAKRVKLKVEQTQRVERHVHLFRLPVPVEIFTDGGSARHTIQVSRANEEFTLPADAKPRMVIFDAGNTLLDATQFTKDVSEWIYQLKRAPSVADRAEAARALREFKDSADAVDALGGAAGSDPFWGVRVQALQTLGALGGPAAKKHVLAALENSEPWVRSVAVQQLGGLGASDEAVATRLESIYRADKAFTVRAAALVALTQAKAPNALAVLRGALAVESPKETIRTAALQGLAVTRDDAAAPLLAEWLAPGKPLALRQAAAGGLGQLDRKNKQITQQLTSVLKEPYFQLRFASAIALGQRGDADAIPALEEFANSGQFPLSLFEGFVRAQIAAIRNANRPAGAAPAAAQGAGGAGAAAPPAGGAPQGASADAAALNRQILEAIERLQRESADILDRLKKLEAKLGEKK